MAGSRCGTCSRTGWSCSVADPGHRHAEHDPLLIARCSTRLRRPSAARPRTRGRVVSGLRRAPRRSRRAVDRDASAADPGATARLHADRRDAARLVAARRGTGRRVTPSDGRDDRSVTSSSHASHDTMLVASLADHSLPAPSAKRPRPSSPPAPVCRPPRRSRRASRRDPARCRRRPGAATSR